MNREDIVRMAREADIHVSENNSFADDMYISTLYRFANVVAAAENEACAKEAENMDKAVLAMLSLTSQPVAIAARIRSRRRKE